MSRSNAPASLGRSVVFHDDRIERLERTGEGGGAGSLMLGQSAPPPPVGETVTQVAEGHVTAGAVTFDGSFAQAGWDSQGIGDDGATTGHAAYYLAHVTIEAAAGEVIRDGSVSVTVDGSEAWGPAQDPACAIGFATVHNVTVQPPAVHASRELGLSVDPGGATVDVTVTWRLVETIAAPASIVPPTADQTATTETRAFQATANLSPPVSTEIGDMLVTVFLGSSQTWPLGSSVFPAGWDEKVLITHATGSSGGTGTRTWVGTRRATAADENGASSYQWEHNTSGNGGARISLLMLRIPADSFATGIDPFGGVTTDDDPAFAVKTLTVAMPFGGWVLCGISGVENQGSPSLNPDLTLEFQDPAVEIIGSSNSDGSTRHGRIRVGWLPARSGTLSADFGFHMARSVMWAMGVQG